MVAAQRPSNGYRPASHVPSRRVSLMLGVVRPGIWSKGWGPLDLKQAIGRRDYDRLDVREAWTQIPRRRR